MVASKTKTFYFAAMIELPLATITAPYLNRTPSQSVIDAVSKTGILRPIRVDENNIAILNDATLALAMLMAGKRFTPIVTSQIWELITPDSLSLPKVYNLSFNEIMFALGATRIEARKLLAQQNISVSANPRTQCDNIPLGASKVLYLISRPRAESAARHLTNYTNLSTRQQQLIIGAQLKSTHR